MYPLAVQSGIDAQDYWAMNFEEIMVQVLANQANKKQDLQSKAMMDYTSAKLMAYAFNDPSKMPKPEEAYPFLADLKPAEKVPDWKKDQLLLMQQAARIKAVQQAKKN